MSKFKRSDNSLNDEDLHTLLDAADIKVPSTLDQAILSQAHTALRDDDPTLRKPSRWEPTWPQAFSTAAVLFIGVMLVPATMNKFEFNERDAASNHAPAIESAVAELTEADVAAVPEAGRAGRAVSAPTSAVLKQSARVHASARPTAESSLSSLAADESPKIAYREFEARWMEEIKRLVSADEINQAREELRLFKSRHPASKLLQELPNGLH